MVAIKRWLTPFAITAGLALVLVAFLFDGVWTLGLPGFFLLLGGLVYGLR